MRIFNLLTSLIAIGFAAQAVAEEGAAPAGKNPNAFATAPEGKTLPEGIMRARIIYGAAKGNGFQYDKNGGKKDSVIDVTAAGGTIVAEYGLSDKISLQFRQDFVTGFETNVNGKRAWESDAYKTAVANKSVISSTATFATLDSVLNKYTGKNIDSKANLTTALLIANAKCNSVETCAAYQASTDATAFATNKSINSNADTLDGSVLSSVKSQAEYNGGKGLADTTIGALMSVVNEGPLEISVGAGIRYPTGNRNRAANERITGRGLTEFGLRTDFDYLPVETLRLSWENQAEIMAMAGKYNQAGKSVTLKRNGVRNKGFFIVKPSLAALIPSLSFIGPKLGMSYDYDSEEMMKVGSETEAPTGARSSEKKLYASLAANFLEFNIPAQLEFEYYKSQSGQNIAAATDSWDIQIKAFAKF